MLDLLQLNLESLYKTRFKSLNFNFIIYDFLLQSDFVYLHKLLDKHFHLWSLIIHIICNLKNVSLYYHY